MRREVTARRSNPTWLVLSVVGLGVAYSAVIRAMPPCDCIRWQYVIQVWPELIAPLAAASVAVIVGIVGAFGFIRLPERLRPHGADSSAVLAGPGGRSRVWVILTTVVAMPVVFFSLSETHPSATGMVPLAGVVLAWVGHYKRSTWLTVLGVVLGIVSGAVLGLALLFIVLLFRTSGVPLI
jgi:hypothetical protein